MRSGRIGEAPNDDDPEYLPRDQPRRRKRGETVPVVCERIHDGVPRDAVGDYHRIRTRVSGNPLRPERERQVTAMTFSPRLLGMGRAAERVESMSMGMKCKFQC
ncbi:hypothetical protein RMSM_05704 [Rhodopirellula maiorica SM1]|uniref:Uncharacterized protein n=1 Tax=Rhodopirellula maiorica SM1 TaxID=1265738 RepID=M5RDB5_9BACT|nr:hypothetical protein RMSM_05704 [Rhodopirellula maiorica SM1]